MELLTTAAFQAGLDALPEAVRRKVPGVLERLQVDPRHPGLQTKAIQRAPRRGVFEARVDQSYRLIYERVSGGLYLWRIGPHDVIDQAHALPAPDRAAAQPVGASPPPAAPPVEPVVSPPLRPVAGLPAGPFAGVPAAVLRLFGVPADRVDEVRALPVADQLLDLGLPPATATVLADLATRPDDPLAALVDPRRLLYRTTVDQLEGYCVGKIKRLLLNLEAEQRRLVDLEAAGPVMVRGVAGSGKTTVGVYRAHRLARGGARVLLLTFNRTLARATEELFAELYGDRPANVDVRTVDAWINAYLARRGQRPRIVDKPEARRLLREAIRAVRTRFPRHPVLNRDETFFADEIESVIKGRAVPDLDTYRTLVRAGRGSGLLAAHREVVWAVHETYAAALAARGLAEWGDTPLMADAALAADPAPPAYDAVIVDETQDLTPAKLRVVQRLVRGPAGRGLYLLADAAQSIYYRGIAWREAGLEVVGRSHRLTRNYRCTRQILDAAGSLLARNAILRGSGEVIEPEGVDRAGPRPAILFRSTSTEAARAAVETVLSLCERGLYRPADFAVLAPTGDVGERARSAFEKEGVPAIGFRDDDFALLENQVKVCTIHSAKGLEFPVVIVVGCDDGLLPPPMHAADDEEATLERERQRRLLYVAMTRAAERLYLVADRRAPSPFLHELDPASVQVLATP